MKYQKIDMAKMIFNRLPIERALLSEEGPDIFDEFSLEEEGGDRHQHEELLYSAVERCERSGNAIFTFADDLLGMLVRTDVLDTPINQLRLPYETIYCHLGETDLIPLENHRVDGFFIDTLLSIEDLNNTRSEAEIRQIVLSDKHFYEHNDFDRDAPSLSAARREFLAKSVDEHIKERLQQQAADRQEHQRYLADPAAYFAEEGEDYLHVIIHFTVVRRDGIIRPLTARELIAEPALSFSCSFEKNTSTVREAISRPDDGPLPCQYSIEELAKIAFNLICYLNWKDRDIELSYPSEKVRAKIRRAPTAKERQRAMAKAQSQGYRLINFCGHNSPGAMQNQATGSTTATHWRRGHWRNQPHGKGRTENRLTWIKPVIVNKGETAPHPTTIYLTERQP